MLASLLPGLRDLRTPLAVGYLYLGLAWLLWGQPLSFDDRPNGLSGRINDLIDTLGSAAGLGALTFFAYLFGSILQVRSLPLTAKPLSPRWVLLRRPLVRLQFLWHRILVRVLPDDRAYRLLTFKRKEFLYPGYPFPAELWWWVVRHVPRPHPYQDTDLDLGQFRNFSGNRIKDMELHAWVIRNTRDDGWEEIWKRDRERLARSKKAGVVKWLAEEADVTKLPFRKAVNFGLSGSNVLCAADAITVSIMEDKKGLATRLLVKSERLHNDYDRNRAEAEIRYSVFVPLVGIVISLSAAWSGWLACGLALPIGLLVQGIRKQLEADQVIWQAVMDGVVSPPITAFLRGERPTQPTNGEVSRPEPPYPST